MGEPITDGAAPPDGRTVLFPGREVKLSTGETVFVRPITFAQLAKAGMHLEKIIAPAMTAGVLTDNGDVDLSNLLGLVTAGGGHVNELILMCVRDADGEPVTRAWLEAVSIEDGIELARALIEVNWREDIGKKLMSLDQTIQALLTGSRPSTG